MHPVTPAISMSFSGDNTLDHFELSGYNLASHTFALKQNVVGKRTSIADNGLPASICGKRSRSNSQASSLDSSSDDSSGGSVFSSDRDAAESTFDSPFSLTTPSRKSSAGEQQLDNLAVWRASILAERQAEPLAKRVRASHGSAVAHDASAVVAKSTPSPASAPAVGPVCVAVRSTSPASSGSPECKNTFVDCLVDTACQTLDLIWKASTSSAACDLAVQTGLPLQVFVRETLRRGRATCSVLQAALLYCARLGDATKQCQRTGSALPGVAEEDLYLLRCPRRMFLASILISSKFLQDRTYSNRAWAKLSGLNVKDLGRMERAFLKAIDYRLVVSEGEWAHWDAQLKRTRSSGVEVPSSSSNFRRTQSDNVSGAAAPYDTELRAASPRAASQVSHKYRPVVPSQNPSAQLASTDLSLPYPMAVPAFSA